MNNKRVRTLKTGKTTGGPVVYWMSRDQRVRDNWALLFAQKLALNKGEPLVVVFCLVPQFLNATIRHYSFMLKGLLEIEADLAKKNITFYLLQGKPENVITAFVKKIKASALVGDFDPLTIKKDWKERVAEHIDIPFYEVDAHNIIPCWIASSKQEFGAYTLRPKINRLLPEFLDDLPLVKNHPFPCKAKLMKTDWEKVKQSLKVNKRVSEVNWINPGEKAANKSLKNFLTNRLKHYAQHRNDPNLDGQSNLSAYLHFGQLSAQRVALEVSRGGIDGSSKAFLEELIVRRELSDNFCFYNSNYQSFDGFPAWAQKTLKQHRQDKREYFYSIKEFENAETHDELWNAAQLEMVERGKMQGYLRMYWAKKILEWTNSPEDALETAIYLNDTYELDGRDPNGYAGIAWSIGGVHDRAWGERPVFGKIRYMSFNGCKAKFNVQEYIGKYKK